MGWPESRSVVWMVLLVWACWLMPGGGADAQYGGMPGGPSAPSSPGFSPGPSIPSPPSPGPSRPWQPSHSGGRPNPYGPGSSNRRGGPGQPYRPGVPNQRYGPGNSPSPYGPSGSPSPYGPGSRSPYAPGSRYSTAPTPSPFDPQYRPRIYSGPTHSTGRQWQEAQGLMRSGQVEQFPKREYTHYFNGIRALKDEDWKTAEAELRKAERLGVPRESVAAWLKMAIDKQKIIWDYAYYTLWALAGWVLGLVALFLVGKLLSTATMRMIKRGGLSGIAGRRRGLRRVYRIVINLAGLYYYVSLPVVVLLALALSLSLGYALLMLPALNFYLIALVLVVGLGSVWTALSGIRACFLRPIDARCLLVWKPC